MHVNSNAHKMVYDNRFYAFKMHLTLEMNSLTSNSVLVSQSNSALIESRTKRQNSKSKNDETIQE